MALRGEYEDVRITIKTSPTSGRPGPSFAREAIVVDTCFDLNGLDGGEESMRSQSLVSVVARLATPLKPLGPRRASGDGGGEGWEVRAVRLVRRRIQRPRARGLCRQD